MEVEVIKPFGRARMGERRTVGRGVADIWIRRGLVREAVDVAGSDHSGTNPKRRAKRGARKSG